MNSGLLNVEAGLRYKVTDILRGLQFYLYLSLKP